MDAEHHHSVYHVFTTLFKKIITQKVFLSLASKATPYHFSSEQKCKRKIRHFRQEHILANARKQPSMHVLQDGNSFNVQMLKMSQNNYRSNAPNNEPRLGITSKLESESRTQISLYET